MKHRKKIRRSRRKNFIDTDMHFRTWLESTDLVDLVSVFMLDPKNKYRVWSCKKDMKGACDGVSEDLAQFLIDHGQPAEMLAGTGYNGKLSPDAHPEWLQFVASEPGAERYLFHVVVAVGDQVIDLTRAQFGDSNWIYPRSEFYSQWNTVKPYTSHHKSL